MFEVSTCRILTKAARGTDCHGSAALELLNNELVLDWFARLRARWNDAGMTPKRRWIAHAICVCARGDGDSTRRARISRPPERMLGAACREDARKAR